MTTASLELCKELYELSGWNDCEFGYYELQVKGGEFGDTWVHDKYVIRTTGSAKLMDIQGFPISRERDYNAYDSGFLLRKLPRHIEHKVNVFHLIVQNGNVNDDNWIADYYQKYGSNAEYYTVDVLKLEAKLTEADTPEDALAKLAIELFKQKILTKEDK